MAGNSSGPGVSPLFLCCDPTTPTPNPNTAHPEIPHSQAQTPEKTNHLCIRVKITLTYVLTRIGILTAESFGFGFFVLVWASMHKSPFPLVIAAKKKRTETVRPNPPKAQPKFHMLLFSCRATHRLSFLPLPWTHTCSGNNCQTPPIQPKARRLVREPSCICW